MGQQKSKIGVEGVSNIEADVDNLILSILENKEIDYYVQKQILYALDVYSKKIAERKEKGYKSKQSIEKIYNSISLAKSKLQDLPTMRYTHTSSEEKQENDINIHLQYIESQLINHKINIDECANILRTVSLYAEKLEKPSLKALIEEDLRDRLSILCLRLFSPTKILHFIEKFNDNLDNVAEGFTRLEIENVSVFNLENAINKLNQTKLKTASIQHLTLSTTAKINQVIEGKASETKEQRKKTTKNDRKNNKDPSNVREGRPDDKITSTENKPETTITEIPGSKFDLLLLLNRFMALLSQNGKWYPIKDAKTKVHFEDLRKKEQQISKLFQTNVKSDDRINILKTIMDEIKYINGDNKEVEVLRIKLVNRIEGLMTVEITNYLRQMKTEIHSYKLYAKESSFAVYTDAYRSKSEKISSFARSLNDLSKGSHHLIVERIKVITKEVFEALDILNKTTFANDNISYTMTILENIEAEIEYFNEEKTAWFTKLQNFNQLRGQLGSLVNFNKKIVIKILEIILKLQKYEHAIYSTLDTSHLIQNIKTALNEQESNFEQLIMRPRSCKEHETKEQKIKAFIEKAKSHKELRSSKILNCFLITCNMVLEFLNETFKENEKVNNYMEELNIFQNNLTRFPETNLHQLPDSEEMEYEIKVIKESVIIPEVLAKVAKIEQEISVQKSKLKLKTITDDFNRFVCSTTQPDKVCSFRDNINKILYLKECIDDMPEGNADLDSNKLHLKEQVLHVLEGLDKELANIVKMKKLSEHGNMSITLTNPFDFDSNALNASEGSIEFVQEIHNKAQSLEDVVKHYLGSYDTVDYYHITETLNSLLEKLDRINCANDEKLQQATVASIEYIIGLLQQLVPSPPLNTSSD